MFAYTATKHYWSVNCYKNSDCINLLQIVFYVFYTYSENFVTVLVAETAFNRGNNRN